MVKFNDKSTFYKSVFLFLTIKKTEEHMNRIKSARPQIDLESLRKIKNGKLHSIQMYKRPTVIKKLEPGKSFLLPILPIDVGPNNLFRVFKQSMPIGSGVH